MSKKMITLTPSARRANRDLFVKHNPWTTGKTIAEIKAMVDAGEHTLAGPFVFAEGSKSTKARSTKKTDTPTAKANRKAKPLSKKERKAKEQKREEFLTWLRETAETRAARKKVNKKAAKWCRQRGIVPARSAWAEVLKGERDVKVLQGLNAADGLTPPKEAKKTATKAGKVTKATEKVVANVEVEADLDAPAKRTRPHRADGRFMTKTQADAFFKLVDNGLEEDKARVAAEVLG